MGLNWLGSKVAKDTMVGGLMTGGDFSSNIYFICYLHSPA